MKRKRRFVVKGEVSRNPINRSGAHAEFIGDNGLRCGKRSTYSKLVGAEALCYAGEISDEIVSRW